MNYIVLLVVTFGSILETYALWDQEIDCPSICTCRVEHLSETAIYRFMQKDKDKVASGESESVENNDVLYEESIDTAEILEHTAAIVRSAICILQTETDPLELLEQLPQNIETLTLIQGYESGNKTIKFSYLGKFPSLLSLELVGPNLLNRPLNNSHLICEIDIPLPHLKFLNLERVLIKNGKQQVVNFLKEVNEEDLTFEYVKRLDDNSHTLTMIQKSTNDEEIVPYKTFKEQRETNGDTPLFIGFKKLFLLRISTCELNNVYWEMFDGLANLKYLMLERNNLRFIPAFAFYGTPNLKLLSLAHNKLLDIEITDLAGLLELEYLDLSYNNFSQLSELSLPPFPKLKLADFANNPISIIFPNTFEVMNTTDSLIIGSDDIPVTLITNSFAGLNLLEKLTLHNLELKLLKRDLFMGMPSLTELVLTGKITEIEYDAFLEVSKIRKLVLSHCQLTNISMDAFMGLQKLHYLDLSKNNLEYLPPGIFDHLINVKELYLNGNKLNILPRDIFSRINAKLIRLNDNPWHCSCHMSDWKPAIINRMKQRIIKPCEFTSDKGIGCNLDNQFDVKYIYDNKVAPKCVKPVQFVNWSVFHAMRRILKCPDYKPKFRKHHFTHRPAIVYNSSTVTTQKPATEIYTKLEKLASKWKMHGMDDKDIENNKISILSGNNQNTEISNENYENNFINYSDNVPAKSRRKHRRGYKRFPNKYHKDISNNI